MVRQCPLHVDTKEYFLGFPKKRAFAVYGPPPGQKKIDPPEPLKRLAALVPPFRSDSARALERQLRDLMLSESGRP